MLLKLGSAKLVLVVPVSTGATAGGCRRQSELQMEHLKDASGKREKKWQMIA